MSDIVYFIAAALFAGAGVIILLKKADFFLEPLIHTDNPMKRDELRKNVRFWYGICMTGYAAAIIVMFISTKINSSILQYSGIGIIIVCLGVMTGVRINARHG